MSSCPDCPVYDGNRNPALQPRPVCCLEGIYLADMREVERSAALGLERRLNRAERRKEAALDRRARARA